MTFEWDKNKNLHNIKMHGIDFNEAQNAFFDKNRIIAVDSKHSSVHEIRYFCFGKIGINIVTVRFTIRGENIRIFGAGYWREGRKKYEEVHL